MNRVLKFICLLICCAGLPLKSTRAAELPYIPDFVRSGKLSDCVVVAPAESRVLPAMVKFELSTNGEVNAITITYPSSVGFRKIELALKEILGNPKRHRLRKHFIIFRTNNKDLSWLVTSEAGKAQILVTRIRSAK